MLVLSQFFEHTEFGLSPPLTASYSTTLLGADLDLVFIGHQRLDFLRRANHPVWSPVV